MENKELESRRQFYISNDRRIKDDNKKLKLRMLRDYCNQMVLNGINSFCDEYHPVNFSFASEQTNDSFIDSLGNLLDRIDDDSISNFFIRAYTASKIIPVDDLMVSEAKSKIVKNGSLKDFYIFIPSKNQNTNLSYAIITHELAHYLLTNSKRKKDVLEYSEVLSIFFEYLMYQEASPNGFHFFLNNRLVLLNSNFEDLKEDLQYATHPEILGIDRKYYEGLLAGNNTYLESIEYVLNLIEREKDNKKDVYSSIRRILVGNSSCIDESRKLDIDTSGYKQLRKIINKQ